MSPHLKCDILSMKFSVQSNGTEAISISKDYCVK